MDGNSTFLWVVLINCSMLLLTALRQRRWTGWATLGGMLLAATPIAYYLTPQQAGFLVGIPWVITVRDRFRGALALGAKTSFC